MMYRTHALFGFLIGLLIYGLDLDSLILVLLVMAGALIPDLDTSVSFLGRRLKIISYPFPMKDQMLMKIQRFIIGKKLMKVMMKVLI